MRWIELGRSLGAAQRDFRLASLKIGCVQSGIAFPEECRLASIVARGERFLILPHTANSKMILKVVSHTWKVLHNGYPQSLEFSLITNARQHQLFCGMNRAQREHHFESGIDALNLATILDLH